MHASTHALVNVSMHVQMLPRVYLCQVRDALTPCGARMHRGYHAFMFPANVHAFSQAFFFFFVTATLNNSPFSATGNKQSGNRHISISPIIIGVTVLGNHYCPGVSSRASQGVRTHDGESPTYLLTLSSLRQPGVAGSSPSTLTTSLVCS